MSFTSINYSRVVCMVCGKETIIEPGIPFERLECDCSLEVSKATKEIKVYINKDGGIVSHIGTFKNGDVEVSIEGDPTTYRIPKGSFEKNFEEFLHFSIPVDPEPIEELPEELGAEYSRDELKELLSAKSVINILADYNIEDLRHICDVAGVPYSNKMQKRRLATKLKAWAS
jgi:hypothetical protein